MSYKLPIYSDEELSQFNSFPPLENGTYEFDVIERVQGKSTKNNMQEQLVFDVYHKGRGKKPKKCYHNITVEHPDEKILKWLISLAKDFLDCVKVKYTPDAFNYVKGKSGKANFFVATYKDKNGKDREKFIVPNEGFISPEETIIGNTEPPKPAPTESFDDDIPF